MVTKEGGQLVTLPFSDSPTLLFLEVVGYFVGRDEFFLERVGAGAFGFDHLDALDHVLQRGFVTAERCDSFLCHGIIKLDVVT